MIETVNRSVWPSRQDDSAGEGSRLHVDLDLGNMKRRANPSSSSVSGSAQDGASAAAADDSLLVVPMSDGEQVFSLNGERFSAQELDLLRAHDWSWDLDAISEWDESTELDRFADLQTAAERSFGGAAGQEFVERLMRLDVLRTAHDGTTLADDFGTALFRHASVPGAFFAEPERATEFATAFCSAVAAR